MSSENDREGGDQGSSENDSECSESEVRRWQDSWYALRVTFGKEDVVKKRIAQGCALDSDVRNSIRDVLIPTERVSELKNGKQCVVERKIWPSYLFIRMDLSDETWQFVRRIDGVLGFVGGSNPSALGASEVKDLLKDLDDKKGSVRKEGQFSVGESVSVIDGALSGLIGEVIAVFEEKGCLSIKLKIFDRESRVDDVSFDQVQKVEEESVASE